MTTKALSTLKLDEIESAPLGEIVAAAKRAGIVPREMDEAAAIAVMLKARELGVPPMAACSSIYIIEGRATCSAQLMLACARRVLGEKLKYTISGDKDKCTGRMSTDGGQTWNEIAITFKEMEMAGYTKTRQGQTKANWKNPAAMLRARVSAALVRLCVPEATLGMHTREEIQDAIRVDHRDVTHAQAVTAKLLGEAAPEPEPDPAETEELPTERAAREAVEEWTLKIEEAESAEAWSRVADGVEEDPRLDEPEREALRAIGADKGRREGWQYVESGSAREVADRLDEIENCPDLDALKGKHEEIKAAALEGRYTKAQAERLTAAMKTRRDELKGASE